MSASAGTTTHEFKAETRQLLDIVIHSLYSNKEIFLRELISNASDALDRLRFESLTQPGLLEKGEILEIRLEVDPEARTLAVSDNGIGMSREEVVAHLGTIAKSGTRELVRQLEESDRAGLSQLIGQFGVGFYSAFMVADEVTVLTRRAGEEQATSWRSRGEGEFEIEDGSRFLRGTTVTLHLRPEDAEAGLEDFTSFSTLQDIVRRYSDFIPYPIRAKRPADPASGKPAEEVTLNSMKPIWTRSETEVSDEELHEFYRHIAHDWSEPLSHLLLTAEGRIEYRALLFVPARAPFDLFWRDQTVGLRLYVKRVLLLDHCEELLPPYLRFVRGVLDSADLQLNVSREMLQQDRHITQMRKWITKRVLDHLAEMKRSDAEKYRRFWDLFGRVLKEGVGSDPDNKERILPLLLFQSSRDPGEPTDLAGYVQRAGEGQPIYYLTGESRRVVEGSPQLEALVDAGQEVLFLTDPVDELILPHIEHFDGHTLRSAAEAELDVPAPGGESETGAPDNDDESWQDLLVALRERLQDQVGDVRLSKRLRQSPCCLVNEAGSISPTLERLLRQTEDAAHLPKQKRILEINRSHPALLSLRDKLAADAASAPLDDYADLLLAYALIAEGSDPPDPGRFHQLLSDLMTRAL